MPLLALAVALVCGAITLFPASAQARVRECARGGATLVAASETVRIVRVAQRRDTLETQRDKLLGCRTTNGRRFRLGMEIDQPDDFFQRWSFQIVDDRYIGAVLDESGAASDFRSAAVWDSRTRRRLHTTSGCKSEPGAHEVVFLPDGGMAYSCDALYLADSDGRRQLEPGPSLARNLAVSIGLLEYRLYWTVTQPDGSQERSLLVRYR